tara:strand:+ start:1657 stop:1818 length:162 start_codon:yes stop_codon:yes gene_type:complete
MNMKVEKVIFIFITIIFLISAIFFREETEMRATSIVVISLVLIGIFSQLFKKK